MKEPCVAKQRNKFERIRKTVVLAITSDRCIVKYDLYDRFGLSPKESTIILLYSDLTGKRLNDVVEEYIYDNGINIDEGDKIIYLDSAMNGCSDNGGDCPMSD